MDRRERLNGAPKIHDGEGGPGIALKEALCLHIAMHTATVTASELNASGYIARDMVKSGRQ
jgi:hypothetical protein